MSDKRNVDREKAEAFFSSPAGFWTVVVLIAGIVLWVVVETIIRLVTGT
jgi:hypothetical protein